MNFLKYGFSGFHTHKPSCRSHIASASKKAEYVGISQIDLAGNRTAALGRGQCIVLVCLFLLLDIMLQLQRNALPAAGTPGVFRVKLVGKIPELVGTGTPL